ncbi:MAG: hypothetical protein ACXWBN_15870 [Acidimicrobiales bacterium]
MILGVIMVVAFGLLVVAALIPSPRNRPLTLEQAGADETVPETATTAPVTSLAPTTTVTSRAPTTTATTDAPSTTSTTRAPAPMTAAVKATPTAEPVTTRPPVTAPPVTVGPSDAAFLSCIRMRESHGDYTAVSASGNFRGAYQFSQSAWDSTARHAGRTDLVGRLANTVAPSDQDALALDLYHWQGATPWGGACT